jgi:hypothetical protein
MSARRLLLAAGLVASPTLLALSVAIEPPVTDRGAAAFVTIAASSERYYVGVLLAILGLCLLPVVGAALAVLVQGRGYAAATAAAILLGLAGVTVAVGKGFQIMLWAMAQPALATDRENFGRLSQHQLMGTEIFFILGSLSIISGLTLAVIALWRSRAVPRWVALLFGVTQFAAIAFSGNPGAGAAVAAVPPIVVSAIIAAALLRAGFPTTTRGSDRAPVAAAA